MKADDALGLSTALGQALLWISVAIPWDRAMPTGLEWILLWSSIAATLLGFWRWTRPAYAANLPIVGWLMIEAATPVVVLLLALAVTAFAVGAYLMFRHGTRFPHWFETFLPH